MFGIGGTELVVLVIVVALLIGPEQIPSIVKGINKFVRDISKAREEFKQSVESDDTLKSIKDSVDDVKKNIQQQVNDITSGVQEDIKKIQESIKDDDASK